MSNEQQRSIDYTVVCEKGHRYIENLDNISQLHWGCPVCDAEDSCQHGFTRGMGACGTCD